MVDLWRAFGARERLRGRGAVGAAARRGDASCLQYLLGEHAVYSRVEGVKML